MPLTLIQTPTTQLCVHPSPGPFLLTSVTLTALAFDWQGIEARLVVWQLLECNQGPLNTVPILFALLLKLKNVPISLDILATRDATHAQAEVDQKSMLIETVIFPSDSYLRHG